MRPAIETAEAGERALVVLLLVTDRIGRDCGDDKFITAGFEGVDVAAAGVGGGGGLGANRSSRVRVCGGREKIKLVFQSRMLALPNQ